MQRIQDPTASATLVAPPALSGPVGYPRPAIPGSQAATRLRYWYVAMLQEELMSFLTAAGVTPDVTGTVLNQVLASCKILFGSTGSLGASGWMTMPGGLILQWGGIAGTTGAAGVNGVSEAIPIAVSFPITFPNAVYRVFPSANDVTGSNLQETAWKYGQTVSGCNFGLSCLQAFTAMTGDYLALGH